MSEENNIEKDLSTPSEEPQQEKTVSEQIIEVEWEQVKPIYEIRKALLEVDTRFSQILLQHEKQRAAFLARSQELEVMLYEAGSTLKESSLIDSSLTYELKMPASEGEKAYFIRKDA